MKRGARKASLNIMINFIYNFLDWTLSQILEIAENDNNFFN